MVERVGFSLKGAEVMDEFYLPEEIMEWLSQKKSEYLSKLIENMESDDFQFHEFQQFEEFLPVTLATPDWTTDSILDGQRIKTFGRSFNDGKFFQQVVIGALVPDQNKNDVFIPIISFVTKKENLIRLFGGGKLAKQLLN